jgi:carbonic anhydrase
MSIFSSQSTWGGACSGANQSPINLSQSIAKPCNLSCELVFDDGLVTTSEVLISDEGLILSGNLGSCKFRGESYTCVAIMVNHPSHHTIEGVQADGEIIAMFRKPTGEGLCVSSLFRVNQAETPSLSFFKQFVPYAQPSAQPTKLMLNNWSIAQMVPPASAYFVYDGSNVAPGCQPVEWVVFRSMINIDPTDFAFLVKNVQPGSRSVQALGNREIFFNSNESLPGGPMPHDNKTYMRCRPSGKKGKTIPVQKVDLKTTEAKEREKNADPNSVTGMYNERRKTISFYDDFLLVFMSLCIIAGLYFGFSTSNSDNGLNVYTYVRSQGAYVGDFIKSIFRKKEETNIPP